MEGAVLPPRLDEFMRSALVTWVRTFVPLDGDMNFDFSVLLDGVFLNDVMTQINPSATPAKKVSRDPSQRTQNLNVLVQRIKTYYQDNLRQFIMIPLPNVLLLGRTPYCEQSPEEMNKLLMLLLGCAVQCEEKEEYIERIQTLETKAAIAAHIHEVTHSQENVLDLQWLESSEVHPTDFEVAARNLATHLQRVLDQRDTHLETIAQLMQEKEGVVSLLNSPSSPQSGSYSPSMQQQTGTQQHLSVELADSKAKIRRLRQELEEKSEQMLDCRHELENMEVELKRIQQENSQLLVDARAARTYRDELDALRERAMKADKLESEVGRYREQPKMEVCKAKVEELKEDNRVLQETKEVLEDQLAGWRASSDRIHHLEKHSLLLETRVHDMEQEREAERKRTEELQDENLALSLAQRRLMEESQHLGWELDQLTKTTESSQGHQTLSDEVSERTCSRMLKLEKENQSLSKTIEELRAASINNNTRTKHGHRLERDVFQETCSIGNLNLGEPTYCHQLFPAEDLEQVQSEILLTENPDLLAREKGQLEDVDQGDHSKEGMSDLKVLENNHNRRHCFVGSRDHSPGSKDCSPCHDSIFKGLPTHSSYARKHTQLEAKCRALDLERTIQRLEAEVQELEAENQIPQANFEEIRISARRLEQLETDKQSLEQETTTFEREKRHLEKENRGLRQQAEIQEANLDSSNVSMAGLEREMPFLVKEVEGTAERVKGLERDNRELTKQAAIDQRTLATLREELVIEKLKTQQRELLSMVHDFEMRVLNQESVQQAEEEAPDNRRFKMQESELESSLKKSLRIKDDKMAALEPRLLESSTLSLELKTVRLSYEALQQRLEEEWTASSSTPPRETGKAMGEWLRESQEATKELLKLKDHLIEVERNNATLEAERQAMQAQLRQLENQSDSQQAQVLALQRQAATLQENNTALQTLNANLQVEKYTLNSQSASLMASKDLFHVEERQYIDKLNDLRRQKERLEEKIMDQYKFYEPSPPRRRGNWFALKMKKLIKSNSHEHGPDRPPTPTHSGVAELHLSNSSIGADGSGASGATSAGDAVSPQRNSTTKMFPRMRNRLKDRKKVKSLFQRSMYKDANDGAVPSGSEDNGELQNHGMNGVESRAQSESSGEFTVSLENEPWSNGSSPVQQPPSRCSSSSFQSPSDTSTPQHTRKQHKEEETATMPFTNSPRSVIQSLPKQKNPVISEDFWLTKGTKSIQRGSRGKVTRRSSDSAGAVKTNPGLNGITSNSSSNKAETTRALACSPITVLYVQGKSSSMSGCLNCFSTPLGKEWRGKGSRLPKSLPRASGVISTAEGSSRRCSVNSDCRVTVKTDPLSIQVSDNGSKRVEAPSQPEPEANNSEPDPMPPVKPPRDPTVVPTDNPKSPGKESLLGSSFTFQSVFSNTIFSESVVTTMTGLETLENNQISPCPNPSLVQNGPLESQESSPNEPQTLLGVVDEQSQNAEHAPAQEEHDEPLTSA
uniref:girdin isoform X9 n=1 Tax=Gasterosteus aculeatus aculeatus TaxID=481459 RepID=UPI001A9A1E66|nr:girdin isoform X9 [Gasterosteus aculeatus aculeatus]